MGKQKVKVSADTVECTNRLDKFERFNSEELKALTNRAVSGLAPVELRYHRKKPKLVTSLTGQIPLSKYLAFRNTTETLLSVIERTLAIAIECERYGLRPDNLCWDFNRVFIDGDSGEITMIYWPVVRLDYSTDAMLSFYAAFAEIMRRDHADSIVLQAYQQYFFQREVINLFNFRSTVRNIYEDWKNVRSQPLSIHEAVDDPAIQSYHVHNTSAKAWLQSEGDSRKIWLTREQIIFGRSKDKCDVVIKHDLSVSRIHAMVIQREDRYYLVDLGSMNGTFLNGTQLAPQIMVLLEDGAVFRLASSSFSFHLLQPELTVPVYWEGDAK